jgi:hypothetical protein
VRVVEHVSGTDTFCNSVTNESVTGTINAGEIVNLVDGTVTESGTVGRITVPHVGVVFFDVGKSIIDFDEGLVFLAGRHHAFFEEDYAQLCSVLGQPSTARPFRQNRRHVLIRSGSQRLRGAAPCRSRSPRGRSADPGGDGYLIQGWPARWWVRERREMFLRVRGADSRRRWVKASDIRPVARGQMTVD